MGVMMTASSSLASSSPALPEFFRVQSLSKVPTNLSHRYAKQRVGFPQATLDPLARSSSPPRARLVARRRESASVVQNLHRPLDEYMRLPASQYSVLDAERIERIDDNTFQCYVYRFKFFNFEVCPVLMVRVEEETNGCCISLLSCKLEGSPIVVEQNAKFSGTELRTKGKLVRGQHPEDSSSTSLARGEGDVANSSSPEGRDKLDLTSQSTMLLLSISVLGLHLPVLFQAASMVNKISCNINSNGSTMQELVSDTEIEVIIDIPFAFRAIPVRLIEASGNQIMEQLLKVMLPRFLAQLGKDYKAWSSGDNSRQPLGTGEI